MLGGVLARGTLLNALRHDVEMVAKLSKTVLICVIGLLSLIIVAGVFYIVSENRGAKTRYSVTAFTPQGDVPQWVDFSWTFSEPLVDNAGIGTEVPQQAIRWTPAVDGKARWVARDKIGFFLESPLVPSARYTVELSSRLSPSDSFVLTGQHRFEFATRRFEVTDTTLQFRYNPDDKQKAKAVGTIDFNYPVNIADLKAHLSIQFNRDTEIPYSLLTETSTARTVTLETEEVERGREDRVLTLRIQKGFKCTGGKLGLAAASVTSLVLSGSGTLGVTYCNVEEYGGAPYLALRFSTDVPAHIVEPYLRIAPNPGNTQLIMRYGEIQIHGDFKRRTTYTLTVQEGLTAQDDSVLKKPYTMRLTIPDVPPRIRFLGGQRGSAGFLAREGTLNLGVATINVNQLDVEIEKVFANNLIYLAKIESWSRWSSRYLGMPVHQAVLTVDARVNEEVTTALPLREVVSDEPGVFKIVVRDANDRWVNAHQWVLLTDLGILAKRIGDALYVWVKSIETHDVVADARVTLISDNNQTLLTGKTNWAGFIKFTEFAQQTEGFVPLLITVAKGDDLAFVQLDRHENTTADFNVAGPPYLEKGYEAFLWTGRGVYRPGETVEFAGIVRGAQHVVPRPLPARVEVLAPDGRILREARVQTSTSGGCEVRIDIPAYAQTGGYLAKLRIAEKEVGRTRFQVEEFLPDRMQVTVTTDKPTYTLGEAVEVEVMAVNLFGPPAAARHVEATCELTAVPLTFAAWEGFTFGQSRQDVFSVQRIALGEAKTDEEGKARYPWEVPAVQRPPARLQGVLTATVREVGGRAVTASRRIDIHPYSHTVGLRRVSLEREQVELEVIAVDATGGSSAGRALTLTLHKVLWNTLLRQSSDGRTYGYVSEAETREVEKRALTSTAEITRVTLTPPGSGDYRVRVTDDVSGARTELAFSVDGEELAGTRREGELDMTLDKPTYRPGQTAKLRIQAPFPGTLLLTVEREKLLSYRTITLEGTSTTVNIPVSRRYAPNVYVSATLLRDARSPGGMTARQYGIVPLKVDAERNRLSITLDVPAEARPNSEVDIPFQVKGTRWQQFDVCIAAVDEGILALTGFETPRPHDYFYRQRGLATRTFDVYGAILPELRTGGDSPAAARERVRRLSTASVMRVKPVSLWTGLVKTDARGRGTARFTLPQFNGTLRLMAVAFAGPEYGAAAASLRVREPIVLTPTFPRFLAGGDKIRIPVTLSNSTGADGTFTVKLTATGAVQLLARGEQQVSVAAGTEGHVAFEARAHDAIGSVLFNLSAAGNSEMTQQQVTLPLRSATPPVTQTGQGEVRADTPVDFVFPANLLAESSAFSLTLSPFPAVQFAESLRYLIGYPYGCVEQTTSRVFPLLYFSELVETVEPSLLSQSGRVDAFVQSGITKLEGMLMPNRQFSYWPGGTYANPWSSLYAAHFLVEARKAGYPVADRVYTEMLIGLRAQAKLSTVQNPELAELSLAAYACYVLAAAGYPEKGAMHYLKDQGVSGLSDYSHFQLAGAFALSGGLETALSILPVSVSPQTFKRETGGTLNSPVRAQAIMLDVLAEVNEHHPAIPMLVRNLAEIAATNGDRWGTTQENAFAFLALGKIMQKQQARDYTGTVTLNGEHFADFDAMEKRYTGLAWDGAQVRLSVEGNGSCYYYWSAFGIPRDSFIEEYSRELQVRRRYFDKDGEELTHTFQHGELIVAEIAVKALTDSLENVVVVDMLPAGFEIENPRLESRADIAWIKADAFKPDYVDIRDDRLIFFGNFPRQRERKFYYALRAVTQGEFILPPVAAEAMYDATKSAVAGSRRIEILGTSHGVQ